MVDTELIVVVTDTDGGTTTLDSNATDPGDRPQGIQFSSQLGSGWYTGGFTLSRSIDRDNIDLHLGDEVTILRRSGETVYESFITDLARSTGSEGHTLTVSLAGWMATAADEPFTMQFVDRDLSKWHGFSTVRRLGSLNAAPTYSVYEPGVDRDQAGNAGVTTQVTGPWPNRAVCEAWYDAGSGNLISSLYYRWQKTSLIDHTDTNWSWGVSLADDDNAGGAQNSSELRAASATATYFTPSDPHRYAKIGLAYNAAGGTTNNGYMLSWQDLAVYGNHGLDLIGSDPGGVAASDVIRWVAAHYCPKLNTAGVQSTSTPISHLVFDQPTKPYDAFLKVNSYHLWDLAVWEDKTMYYQQIDLTEWDWEVRHDEVGNQIGLQGDSITNLRNGIIVQYTDVTSRRVETLHPDDYEQLRDESVDNPLNQQGRRGFGEAYTIPFPTTAEDALELGRIKLLEDLQVTAPGQFTVGPWIKDRTGTLQPVSAVRSGQRVRLTSSANLSDRPRLIREVQYAHDARTATISVDSTTLVLDAIVDRHQTALVAAGLQ